MNTKKITSEISKLGIELSKIYDKYSQEKYKYINHKRIIEYLFNKPLEKISTNYESTVRLVRLELSDPTFISCKFDIMHTLLSNYSEKHKNYVRLCKKYYGEAKSMNINYLPTVYELSHQEKNIMKILDLIESKVPNKFKYIYKWNFMVEGEDNNIVKLPTVNYQQPFVYDFYGVTMWHNQLVQFVILFDNDNSQTDIEKQYILHQMNIHLLRLNRKSNFKKDIISFIKRIRNSTEYIIQGALKPSTKVIDFPLFDDDYEYNHKIYLKIPPKKYPKYDSDDDDFFEYQFIKDQNEEIDAEPSLVVTSDFFQKILEEKKDLHPPKKKSKNEQKAEKIIVELIKNKK